MTLKFCCTVNLAVLLCRVLPYRRKRWSTTNPKICKLAEWFWFRPSLSTFPAVVVRVYGFKEVQLRNGEHCWLDEFSFLAHAWKHIKHDLFRIKARLDTPYGSKTYRYSSGM